MQQDFQRRFMIDTANQLKQFYQALKLNRKLDLPQKHRIEGFMLAGMCLGLTDKAELEALMEKVHTDVFGISIAERRLLNLKGEQQEIDWSYYDKPITER